MEITRARSRRYKILCSVRRGDEINRIIFLRIKTKFILQRHERENRKKWCTATGTRRIKRYERKSMITIAVLSRGEWRLYFQEFIFHLEQSSYGRAIGNSSPPVVPLAPSNLLWRSPAFRRCLQMPPLHVFEYRIRRRFAFHVWTCNRQDVQQTAQSQIRVRERTSRGIVRLKSIPTSVRKLTMKESTDALRTSRLSHVFASILPRVIVTFRWFGELAGLKRTRRATFKEPQSPTTWLSADSPNAGLPPTPVPRVVCLARLTLRSVAPRDA